jgi:cytochrome d ubiquinol oxidase subunit II
MVDARALWTANMSTLVAIALLLGVVAYVVFGGADFGAGFWDLTAGGAQRGRAPRALIDQSLGPVWEANHTWLIYCLVVFWTAFPPAFATVMRTVYIPLGLAALGIVLRGSGFAFRNAAPALPHQRAAGAAFATSSVVTPFFFGAVAGAIASGRVPGGPLASWVNPTSLFTGVLAVAVCAYLAAVFLTADAPPELVPYFRQRAWITARVAGLLSVAGIFVLRADSRRLFDGLLGRALPVVVLSMLTGVAALVLLRRAAASLVRALAALAVAAIVVAWGVAQYPYMLGTRAAIGTVAAPDSSPAALVVVVAAAILLVGPSFALLYVLQQRQLRG